MHGDETTGYVLMLHLIDYMLSNYGIGPQVTNLIDEVEIWINPLANPDGTYHGGNNSVWEAIRYNVNGVDLNRNFPDPEDGPHPDGNEWQPETIAMMDFAEEHNFVLGANFHSGEEVVNYPWDTWSRLHADDEWYQDISHTYADAAQANSPPGYMNGFNNGITNGYAWYSINGGRQDYMNYFQNAREVTIELSEVKLLPEAQLLDHWNYNKDSFFLYMEEGLYGIRGIVTNDSFEPLDAVITVIDHDIDNSEIVTDPDIGNYHRMLYPDTYNLMFYSYGYLPQIVENINVTGGDITFVDVELESAQQVTISGIVINGGNGNPIENAIVEILNTPLDPVTTNSFGEYIILGVFEGTYNVRVSAVGFAPIIEEIVVSEENNIFDFQLFECEIESFETGDFSSYDWEFGGNAIWGIDSSISFDGIYSAKSGNITHNQNTQLYITLDVLNADEISFYIKVSSESGYDFLRFYIDETLQGEWSGYIDWGEESYFVTPGSHTFKWQYTKDGSVSTGSDCSWIDFIIFPEFEGSKINNYQFLASSKFFGNYPNPFNPAVAGAGRSPETTISFSVAQNAMSGSDGSSFVNLSIYNIKGQKVRTLINKEIDAGHHKVVWDGKDDNNRHVASGIYFYKLSAGKSSEMKKMLLLK